MALEVRKWYIYMIILHIEKTTALLYSGDKIFIDLTRFTYNVILFSYYCACD